METLNLILEENNLEEAAKQLLAFSGATKVFLFNAQMGAGKTTFIKAICKSLGVNDNMSSPTYSIVNEYKNDVGDKIYHFDLYRLKNVEECFDIGFEEYIESGHYCFVEWPEIAESSIMTNVTQISIEIKNGVRYLSAAKKEAHV